MTTTDFFILTQRHVVGPFNGVELREAALAGILRPDGIIGAKPEGPWYNASDIGLFSEAQLALPHPPEVHVPHFQVRGMSGAFQGPFKLRELIGFAARGMLPPEALLQCDDSDQWIPAINYRMIHACLSGQLVLLDSTGRLVKRNISLKELDLEEIDGARAPIEVVRAVDQRDTTAQARERPDGEQPEAEQSFRPIVIDVAQRPKPRRGPTIADRLDRLRQRVREFRSPIPTRYAIQLALVLLIFAGVASAYSYWMQIGLQRHQVIGSWIAADGQTPRFAVALHDDGTCVIVNNQGRSWTGSFEWDERRDDESGLGEVGPFLSVFDTAESHHTTAPVLPTDGYVRLQGYGRRLPELDGHPIRDLFLRRQSNELQLGYLTSVYWKRDGREIKAGWVRATRSNTARPDVGSRLRAIDVEFPVPSELFAGERPLHISHAVDVARNGNLIEVGGRREKTYETMAYSDTVSIGYLIAQFGLPDEARPLSEYEIPELRSGPSFDDAQVITYNDLQFIYSASGELLYLRGR